MTLELAVDALAQDDPPSRATLERAVVAGAVNDPVGLPLTDPSLPPTPGREPSGVRGRRGAGSPVHPDVHGAPRTLQQYAAYVHDHVDPYFGDLDAAYVIRQLKPKVEPPAPWRSPTGGLGCWQSR